jgi:DNA-binding ferritin-like protein
MADIDPVLEDKLVDHLKDIWANNVALYCKVEGFSLGSEGPTAVLNHHMYKKIAKKIMWHNHKIGHAIRFLDETPPASIERVTELSEIKDATEVPDVQDINTELLEDFETQIARVVKGIKRAHDTEQYGISSILGKYMKHLQHWAWHARATVANQKPEEI